MRGPLWVRVQALLCMESERGTFFSHTLKNKNKDVGSLRILDAGEGTWMQVFCYLVCKCLGVVLSCIMHLVCSQRHLVATMGYRKLD